MSTKSENCIGCIIYGFKKGDRTERSLEKVRAWFPHSSDYKICVEVVVSTVSSFLMSEDNTCKGLTIKVFALERQWPRLLDNLKLLGYLLGNHISQNKIVCNRIENKIMTEYLSPVAKALAFCSRISECSFKSVWEKNSLPVLVKQQNVTATSRRRILLRVDHSSV